VDRRKDSQLRSSSQEVSPTTNLTKSALTLVENGAAGSMSVRFVGNYCGPQAIIEAYNHMFASVQSRGQICHQRFSWDGRNGGKSDAAVEGSLSMAKPGVQFLRLCNILGLILLAANVAEPQKTPTRAGANDTLPPGYSTSVTGGIHDFDFYIGAWTVHSRGLKARNVGSKDWREFSSVICVTPYLNGGVNVSEMYSPASGSSGLTLRTFDLEKRQWVVHYISNKTGQLDPGMFGGFDGSQGEFFGADVDNGKPIKARILWTETDHDHVHWEQAFSYYNRTWETNWISEMTRASPSSTCEEGHPNTKSH
jgi:hypothetical protein